MTPLQPTPSMPVLFLQPNPPVPDLLPFSDFYHEFLAARARGAIALVPAGKKCHLFTLK